MKVTLIQKWNAILSKFKPGRMAALGQERVIMDNILSLSPDVTEADDLAVICAIHVIVYKKIHSVIYTRKREICSQTISSPKPESLDLWWSSFTQYARKEKGSVEVKGSCYQRN